jgi:hypothetical protein
LEQHSEPVVMALKHGIELDPILIRANEMADNLLEPVITSRKMQPLKGMSKHTYLKEKKKK